MDFKKCLVLLPIIVVGAACSNPVEPIWGTAQATVQVTVIGIDQQQQYNELQDATVKIIPHAPEGIIGADTVMTTDEHGQTAPYTCSAYRVRQNHDGSYSDEKTVTIDVQIDGWDNYRSDLKFNTDTALFEVKLAFRP